MTGNRFHRLARGLVPLALLLPLLWGMGARGIDPGDHLFDGQHLVDLATVRIDSEIARIRSGALEPDVLYEEVRGLLRMADEFAETRIAALYRLDGPAGLLITDGISDTLVTRLHALLSDYVAQNPEGILDQGRASLEVGVADVMMPPGRLLGFHVVRLARMYGAVADTVLAMPDLASPGVRDGFLRRLWDLAQVYEQIHRDPSEIYFCRIAQEDWLASRIVCEKCAHRGLQFVNQMTGIREDTTAACREVMDPTLTDPSITLKRIDCRHWGHIFTAECPECGERIKFSVPLPYFKIMQRETVSGALKDVEMPPGRVVRF